MAVLPIPVVDRIYRVDLLVTIGHAGVLVRIPAGVNPVRAIGPMILAGQFSDWWAYLAAPLAGGAIAVALYDRFLRAGSTPA